jgi:hypothetical protein
MGMNIASKLIEKEADPETKLWRAVIILALEDVTNKNQNRLDSVLKGRAHDWLTSNSRDFEIVCINADLEPKFVRERYLTALEKGLISFTKRQNLNIKYTDAYDNLRNAKEKQERKRWQKVIDDLRQALFKLEKR